jgi:predicted acyltransferase
MFIFVSGITIPYSINKRIALSQGKRDVYIHILKRFVVFYILGLIAGAHLNEFRHESFTYIPLYNNILQQIGISFAVCALILVWRVPVKTQIYITAGLLILYWLIFLFVPAPYSDDLYSKNNIATYVDRMVLGTHSVGWKKGSYSFLVLGTINFISNMMIGVLIGHTLRNNRNKKDKAKLLFACGLGMMAAGLLWGQFFPIIRALWSSSYVLLTCGISTVILALFYVITDIRGYTKWGFFFLMFGVNSIAIYFAAHIYNFRNISNTFVGGLSRFLKPDLQNFIESAAALIVMWLILLFLYRKKVFIKV